MRIALPALLLLALPLAAPADDEEVLSCDSAAGFQTAMPGGGKPAEAELRAVDGNLVLSYEREKMAPLANYALLTELKELRLRLHSTQAATFVVVVKDRDGASWNQPFALPAAEWTDVVVSAEKFTLNHDSVVKKPRFDPARLGSGWLVLDAAAILGKGKGANELRVDEVRIVREGLEETAGEWVVENEQTVTKSRRHRGKLVVRPGGKLTLTAPRFVLDGELAQSGGTVEFRGGGVDIPQRFQHERNLRLTGDSRLAFRGVFLVTHFPAGLKLDGAQTVEMDGTECLGGFTCDVPPKGRIALTNTKNPGEFVVAPGGAVLVDGCENVILWHTLAANLQGALSFPGPEVGKRWTSGHGLDVTVENSRGLRWTLLSLPGSAGSVENCDPMAAGLLFGGKSDTTLDDLQNGRAMADWRVPAPDRALTFRKATVGAWNVYASDDAKLRVRKSTIGEAMTFGKARIELEDTTVDGTGGYVGAHDDSVIRLTRCKVTCLVVAHHRTRVELVDCAVTGDVRAVDSGRVVLTRTTVSGKVEADAGATVEGH